MSFKPFKSRSTSIFALEMTNEHFALYYFQIIHAPRQCGGHRRKPVAPLETSASQRRENQGAGRRMKGITLRKE